MRRVSERPSFAGGLGRDDLPKVLAMALPELRVVGKDGRETCKYTTEDINKFSAEKMWELYELMAAKVMGGGQAAANMHMVPLEAMIDDPEQFTRFQPRAAACKIVSAVIADLSLDSLTFSITDVITPCKKTGQVLALLGKFFVILQKSCEHAEEIQNSQLAKKMELVKFEERVKVTEDALEKRTAEVEQCRREEESLTEERSKLDVDLQNLYELSQSTKNNIDQLNTELENLDREEIAENEEYRALCLRNEVLSSKVATSPDRLHAEYRFATEQVADSRKALNDKRNLCMNRQEQERVRSVVMRTIGQIGSELKDKDDLKHEMDKAEELKQNAESDVRIAEGKVSSCREGRRRLETEEKLLVSKFACERDSHDRRVNDLRAQLIKTQKDVKESQVRNEGKNKENLDRQKELTAIKNEMAVFVRTSEVELNKLSERNRWAAQQLKEKEEEYNAKKQHFQKLLTMVRNGVGDLSDRPESSPPDNL